MKLVPLISLLQIVAIAGLSSPVLSQAEPATLQTKTAESESVTKPAGTSVEIPKVPAPIFAKYLTLPWDIKMSVSESITSNSPITDKSSYANTTPEQYSQLITAWVEQISTCSKEKPNLYRVVEEETKIPVTINKITGKIFLNANKKPVCVL
jgi:hypothetical protein